MNTRFATLFHRLALTFLIALGLSACGGGGGGGSGGGFLGGGGDTELFVTVELYDAVGNPTREISSTNPGTLLIRVTKEKARGAPIAQVVVRASVDLGSIDPTSGSALTDENGEAFFQLLSDGTLGAGTVTVEVDGETEVFTGTFNFRVGLADIRLGTFIDGIFQDGVIGLNAPSISSGGTALLMLSVVGPDDQLVETDETIKLSSGCALSGTADLTKKVTTIEGQAEVTYTDKGCNGDDEITAVVDGAGATAGATLNIASPEANSVDFVSIMPESGLISLKGTGAPDRPEIATVTFRVVAGDASAEGPGTPIVGALVSFELSTQVGGLELLNSSSFTDENGEVQTIVQSGNVSTTVRVTATTENDQGGLPLTTISDPIVVSTGLPDQNSISVSVATADDSTGPDSCSDADGVGKKELTVPGANDTDGLAACIYIRMADKFNNPVADGTSVTVTTEYGAITSACVLANGFCGVRWVSQDPRTPEFNKDLIKTIDGPGYDCPSHKGSRGPCPDNLGFIRGGRSTVLVTAVGEESFLDANGNGLYDRGEDFTNLPEAFIDHNEDGVYTPVLGCPPEFSSPGCEIAGSEETFVDFNSDGVYNLNVDPPQFPNGVYNGSLCPEAGDGVYCSRELLNVRDSAIIVLGTTNYEFLLVDLARNVRNSTFEGDGYNVYISDQQNSPPPAGTTISVTGCNAVTSGGLTVPEGLPGAFGFGLQTTGKGNLTVAFSTGGIPYSQTYPCDAPDPPDEGDNDGGGLVVGP